MIKLSGVTEFQWKTTEQVYPFEKGKNGETLYCRRFDVASTPNGTWTFIPHGLDSNHKGYRIWGNLRNPSGWAGPNPSFIPLPMNMNNNNLIGDVYADATSVAIFTASLWAGVPAEIFFIYSKV